MDIVVRSWVREDIFSQARSLSAGELSVIPFRPETERNLLPAVDSSQGEHLA
jgi:hypothetical protein